MRNLFAKNRMAVLPIVVKDRSLRPAVPRAEGAASNFDLASEDNFLFTLAQERKRSDRSGRPFLLLLFSRQQPEGRSSGMLVENVISALRLCTRDTDTAGWYEENAVIGVLFTELPQDPKESTQMILTKVTEALNRCLELDEFDEISITYHLYPESTAPGKNEDAQVFFREAAQPQRSNKGAQVVKRLIDFLGSLAAIVLLSPVLLAIAAAIKLTSDGPVLFRQKRVGQFGKPFTFLKFRSMLVNNDPSIHKDYVTRYISGKGAEKHSDGEKKVYKITRDPRVTAVGRLIRRTSLDELPQLFNVLLGNMSLVGPRPPLPYEFECYGVWHRRRVFEVKPGITGLWQVSGRSKTSFDDMVRLDLTYVRTWSLWLDLVILLRTPKAVLGGDGAY